MNTPLGEYSPEQFLAEYWQKKPCLIRQALPGFQPMLDGNDLAGLACEEMAESRLIRGSVDEADWRVEHGPFTDRDFAALGDRDWTLLVQDVEKHYAPLQELMQLFSFLPNWRLDDLMISFAATGGSVGPHTDEYDVFLLQAEGRRSWQIATRFDPELQDDCALKVLKHFEPEQEWVLEPGDLLYLPPNVAHLGVALEPGMTWSIGLRAPSCADLLQGLGEWLAFASNEGGRYTDASLTANDRAGEISPSALQRFQQLMRETIDDEAVISQFLGSFLSRYRLAHEPVAPPQQIDEAALLAHLVAGKNLLRNPWTRLNWIENANGAHLYAAGQVYDCSIELAEALCQPQPQVSVTSKLDSTSLSTLLVLINNGHFIVV